jgi:hypothetical protein
MGFISKISTNYILKNYKSANDYRDYQHIIDSISITNLRSKYKVLLIDDDDQNFLELVKNRDIKITHVKDIDDIYMADAYDIIVCDIKGVGKKFTGNEYGGKTLITEFKKKLPNKYLIAYSANEYDFRYHEVFAMCDDRIIKEHDADKFSDVIDDSFKKYSDPSFQWEKMRNYLFDKNFKTVEIAVVEDYYFRCISEKKILSKEMFASLEPAKNDKSILEILDKSIGAVLLVYKIWSEVNG